MTYYRSNANTTDWHKLPYHKCGGHETENLHTCTACGCYYYVCCSATCSRQDCGQCNTHPQFCGSSKCGGQAAWELWSNGKFWVDDEPGEMLVDPEHLKDLEDKKVRQ